MFNFLVQAAYLLITGDFTGSDAWGGIMEDDPIIDFLFNIRELFFPKN